MCAFDNHQQFCRVGLYELRLVHTEARLEWGMLPKEEKIVRHMMRIKVENDSIPPELHFIIRPKPAGPLYQTPDRTRPLRDQLYSIAAGGTPTAFQTSLLRVDPYGNQVCGTFKVRLFLREQSSQGQLPASTPLYRDFNGCVDELHIPQHFITNSFLAQGGAAVLEANKTYVITTDSTDTGECCSHHLHYSAPL